MAERATAKTIYPAETGAAMPTGSRDTASTYTNEPMENKRPTKKAKGTVKTGTCKFFCAMRSAGTETKNMPIAVMTSSWYGVTLPMTNFCKNEPVPTATMYVAKKIAPKNLSMVLY